MTSDVTSAVDALAKDPIHLIGVRHHSPSLARVMPRLLDATEPDSLVIEMPPEATDWLLWIAHPDATAPLAFAIANENSGISFWPMADFSPELVAVRWAHARHIPVVCADLSPAAHLRNPEPEDDLGSDPRLARLLDTYVRAEHPDDAWDRLVEVPSAGQTPEAVRRSALAFGWAYRQDQPLDARTAAREASMRNGIRKAHAQHGPRTVVVTGAWHSPALTQQRVIDDVDADAGLLAAWEDGDATASLVAYANPMLDSRSGYPSGIRDPRWQHTVLTFGDNPAAFTDAVAGLLTRMAAGIRAAGHPCGPAEIREAHRMTLDLAALRGLPAPGRRELLEACTTVFAHGDVLGRGRVVARVAQDVLVGDDEGRLASDTPRSGLAPAFTNQIERLRLPGPGEPERELTLEPLRREDSELDTQREIFLHRCRLAGLAYAVPEQVHGVGGAQAVSTRWRVHYGIATEAALARASRFGVTVEQAAEGTLRNRRPDSDAEPSELVTGLIDAIQAGLVREFDWWLDAVATALPTRAGIDVLTDAITTLAAVSENTVAGALDVGHDRHNAVASATDLLVDAAIAQVTGIAGSDEPADARALGRLVALKHNDLGVRLHHTLTQFLHEASPLMQGAATALLHHLGADHEVPTIAEKTRGSAGAHGLQELRRWLVGLVTAAPELLTDDPELLEDLRAGVEDLHEALFINRLPALRGGFDPLSAAERERLLTALGADRVRHIDVPAEELGRWAAENQAAWERLQRLGLTQVALAPEQRWALVLGRRRDELTSPEHRRIARSLDQLYGSGAGEGSAATDMTGGGGREPAYPTAREWADELDALFGEEVREDVAAVAVEQRNPLGMDLLVTTQPRASVELLTQVLTLAGGMPEGVLARLRPLLKRMIAEVSQALANRLRPALRGLQGWRPTTRPSPRLDPVATIRRNLRHAVRGSDGRPQLVVANPVFRQPVARRAEWHIVVVVDVSGSMEPSTVFAALTASILAGVDALSVTFLAFSTDVIDLTEHVTDPLSLLLEIHVGGGTNIAHALTVAQSRVTVPSRTMLVVISDFEEGGSVAHLLHQVEALNTAGVRLLGCAALDDAGMARFNPAIAGQVAAAGMPVSAVSPTALAGWIVEQVNR